MSVYGIRRDNGRMIHVSTDRVRVVRLSKTTQFAGTAVVRMSGSWQPIRNEQ